MHEYEEWIRQHTAAVKAWIKEADEEYRKTLEKASSTTKLGHLVLGDQVSHKVPDLERKERNAGTDTWDGPWEVVQPWRRDGNRLPRKTSRISAAANLGAHRQSEATIRRQRAHHRRDRGRSNHVVSQGLSGKL